MSLIIIRINCYKNKDYYDCENVDYYYFVIKILIYILILMLLFILLNHVYYFKNK